MNKQIEQIYTKIDKLLEGEAPSHDQQCVFDDGYFTGIGAVSKFLDTLPDEQPSKDLEEAKEAYCNEHNDDCFDAIGDKCPHIRKAFVAGAKWQKEQMLKDAIEGKVAYFERKEVAVVHYDDPIGDTMCYFAPSDRLEVGDKVKIIIVKEEDER